MFSRSSKMTHRTNARSFGFGIVNIIIIVIIVIIIVVIIIIMALLNAKAYS